MKTCVACGKHFDRPDFFCPKCEYRPKMVDGFFAFAPELATDNDGYEVSLYSQLARLESKNFWFRSRNRLIFWALRHYFPNSKKFLEIGCGTGFVLSGIEKEFPNLQSYGSEIFVEGLHFASQRLSRTKLIQMDGSKIPFYAEFDVIGCFDVLEHIDNDREVIAAMYRAINKHGGILLTVPQHPWLWSQSDEVAHHVRRYEFQDLKQKLENAGFQIIRTTSFVSLLLLLMMVSRLLKQRYDQNYDVLAELRISGWLNTILEAILNLEQILIQLGISFPLGGSLLVVAQKL
jgi:SAM-dependent methyltransferase